MAGQYGRTIEVECLLRIIESVQNGNEVPQKVRSVDWDQIYKLADYHKVANLIYLALIGMETTISEKTHEKFFARYQESFLSGEKYEREVERIMLAFDRNEIHCMLFGAYIMRSYYPIKEMQMLSAIEIFIEEEQLEEIEFLLERIGYEKSEEIVRIGHKYKKGSDSTIILRNYAKITGKKKKYKKKLLRKVPTVIGHSYIHQWDRNAFYVHLIQELVDYYAEGEINVRHVLDYWNYYKQVSDTLNWNYIEEELNKLQLLKFATYIRQLAHIWFDGQIATEDQEIYYNMEQYILTKGANGRAISKEFLPLIQVEEKKERVWEQKKRRKERHQWKFPRKEYMKELFPILNKYPMLLPIFWLYRLYFIYGKQKKNDDKS